MIPDIPWQNPDRRRIGMRTKLRLGPRCVPVTLLLCVTLLASAAVFPQEASVSGTWDITLETGQGTATPSVTFEQKGETLTGTYKGRLGESKVTGTLKGREIRFSVSLTFQDQPITVTYTGTVEKETMKGKVQFGEQRSASWSAKKRS
jgi:hypothetical protein